MTSSDPGHMMGPAHPERESYHRRRTGLPPPPRTGRSTCHAKTLRIAVSCVAFASDPETSRSGGLEHGDTMRESVRRRESTAITAGLAALLLVASGIDSAAQAPRGAMPVAATSVTTGLTELRQLDALVETLVRADELVIRSRYADRQLAGRVHESAMQYHRGVPVYGGGITRQLAGGATVSIFGTIHQGIDIDTTPALSATAARTAFQNLSGGAALVSGQLPSLTIFPLPGGSYALTWRATMSNARTYFLDAGSGQIIWEIDERRTQDAVGTGTGVVGDRKKVSAMRSGGTFQARDRLRPGETVTLDVGYSEARHNALLLPFFGPGWTDSDVAADSDNVWEDPAVVDVHAHMGFTYDYLARQHGWSGVDGANGRVFGLVNNKDLFYNAFAYPPPFGPDGTGVFVFGELPVGFGGRPDVTPIVAVDIVAHELMHNVTHFSVSGRTGEGLRDSLWSIRGPSEIVLAGRTFRCGQYLRYSTGPYAGRRFQFACQNGWILLIANHGGAVNEAFSDIIGTATEFSLHDPGAGPNRADYLMGEDIGWTIRSLGDPGSISLGNTSIPFPDAYGGLARFVVGIFEDTGSFFFLPYGSVDGGRTIVTLPGTDSGGVHWNATILGHAFYLAIEGGRNRTTGIPVAGVGGANRQDVERVFFRAMTELMPASTNFGITAATVRQSAVDLFGAGSGVYASVDQALRAVGLQ